MKKIKNCLFALIGVTVLSAGLASCNGGQDVTSETPITSQTDTSSVTSTSTVPVNYITIAEAKTKSVGTTVTVRGKVTAVSGTSAFISDSTGGIYVYNIAYDATDTAINNKTWTLGMSVEVKSVLAEYSGLIQLSNYSNGKITGTYAVEVEEEVTAMTPIELNETTYAALTSANTGNLYTFTATFVDTQPKTGTAVSCNFTLGSTKIVLRTDKYDTVGISTTFVAGSQYKFTIPLSWYGTSAQFALVGTGVIIEVL